MKLFVEVRKNQYYDSLQSLYATSCVSDMQGVDNALIAMAAPGAKSTFAGLGMSDPRIDEASANDLVIAVVCESEEVFCRAVAAMDRESSASQGKSAGKQAFATLDAAVLQNPKANLCVISIPGEHVRAQAEKALNKGLHLIIFSNNVPMEDERVIKELAREKGLLCMGPDCGVVNLNGICFVLGSINNRGPFGICGASGVGIQLIAALLHRFGSGASQVLGTGGNDLKDPVGGITMLMGIDALEKDPGTEYIILLSRKPADSVIGPVLSRISKCTKPVVVYFMGCTQQEIEAAGAIYACSIEDAAAKALELIGKKLDFGDWQEQQALALDAVKGMSGFQKYVRGAFTGGTFTDEAMRTMTDIIGDIYSNVPMRPDLLLPDSSVSYKNTCIDYGEEEFTLGRPHPIIDPNVRRPAILREAKDPEVAVLLLDIVLSPAGHMDPAGVLLEDIRQAMNMAKDRGGKLAVVASITGTDADWQNLREQEEKLRNVGVYVCPTNYRAARLAGEMIRLKNKGEYDGT